MRFDLADLRLFLSVIDSSSITQGASNAHIAAPSASERIRNMEHEIGTALLFREPRGVKRATRSPRLTPSSINRQTPASRHSESPA